MKIWKRIMAVSLLTFLCFLMSGSVMKLNAATEQDIVPYAFRDSLPVQYEVWYSYALGAEYRNYVYKDFNYVNGYNRTDTLVQKIELSPLDYEFYSKAELWKVSYSFY